jgi:4-amino-4-deoxychorismate lyase
MCRLIETIKVVDGQFQNIAFHNSRLNNSRKELFKSKYELDISTLITIPSSANKGTHKCTLTYNEEIIGIHFQPYTIRKIESLKMVTSDHISYQYKYADRSALSELLNQKGYCDEIIIVKNNRITDTSFSNLIFFNGNNWLTPNSPLLKGTKREKLLEAGSIVEANIKSGDLAKYEKVGLINAMLEIGESTVDISNVIQ